MKQDEAAMIESTLRRKGELEVLSNMKGAGTKLRLLGIRDRQLASCSSLDALKELGQKNYARSMRFLHPDSRRHANRGYFNMLPRGITYSNLMESYRWLLSLTEEDLRLTQERSRSVPDVNLMHVFSRPTKLNGAAVALGNGYQEDFDHMNHG